MHKLLKCSSAVYLRGLLSGTDRPKDIADLMAAQLRLDERLSSGGVIVSESTSAGCRGDEAVAAPAVRDAAEPTPVLIDDIINLG